MPSKTVTFKLNGKEAFDPKTIFMPGVPRIMRVLNESAPGDILESGHLSEKLGILADTLSRKYGPELEKRGYALLVSRKRYYGNPETIKALKHELNG